MICCRVSWLTNSPDSLWRSRLREFQILSVKICRKKTTEVDVMLPRVSIDAWSRFTSRLRVFGYLGVSNVCAWKTPEVKIPEVDDLSPWVMIDEWPRFFSGLCLFGSFKCLCLENSLSENRRSRWSVTACHDRWTTQILFGSLAIRASGLLMTLGVKLRAILHPRMDDNRWYDLLGGSLLLKIYISVPTV